MKINNINDEKTGTDYGGTYKYKDCIDYDTCCTCDYFSDNKMEERF